MARSDSKRKTTYDCLGLGVNAVDHLCILDPYPALDDKVDVKRSSLQGGGPVPTAMVTLARLGAKVCYVGKVGDDPDGEFIRAQFKKEGVDTRHLLVDKKIRTSRASIWIDRRSGKRTVALDRDRKNRLKRTELEFMNSVSSRFLHLDAREVEISILAARWARKHAAQVCLDVGSLRDGVEKLFPLVDHLIVSSRFACGFTKISDPANACRALMKREFTTVVVTVGEEGCICGAEDKLFRSPGFPVKVVDTTGAGDVFHGAFIYGLLKRWSLRRAARFANACAAIKCRKLGGRAGIPTLNEVDGFIDSFS
jgi:ribokinase